MTTPTPAPRVPLFRRIRRAWAEAPALLQVLAVSALYLGFLTALDLGSQTEGASAPALRIVIAMAFGVIAIGSRVLRARRRPAEPRWVDLSEAVEDGELPSGADAPTWIAALERRRAEIRQEAWVVPVGLVLIVGLVLLDGGRRDPALAALVLLAVFVTWGTSLLVSRRRRRDGVDALLIPLQERSRRDEASRAAWPPPATSPGGGIPPTAV
ncbi:hypothetical protein C5E16_11905 [Clavibacter michiganensis]|uniref:Uncharacterized protein n=1 Tax=Clavibacter michiganensis TaxID=28447 RepID=A0A2S5VS06_9MICO|nr:hypothetical protein [Clavibacter michiganensis]PPF66342.1 hypothetical protein C5E16_11905 [Clavibacter michiganensis]